MNDRQKRIRVATVISKLSTSMTFGVGFKREPTNVYEFQTTMIESYIRIFMGRRPLIMIDVGFRSCVSKTLIEVRSN